MGNWNVGSRRVSSESWKLKSKLRKLNVGSCFPNSGRWMFGPAISILFPRKNVPKIVKKRRFSRGKTSRKKRPWKPVGTREDPWGPAPHTRLDFPARRLFAASKLPPGRNANKTRINGSWKLDCKCWLLEVGIHLPQGEC